jgi:hypothetical protein
MHENHNEHRWRGRAVSHAALVTMAFLLIGAGASDVPRVGLAVGTVEIGRGQPPVWGPAQGGEFLSPGDSVRTGPGGRVELELGTGTVRVYENSLLRLPSDAVGKEGARAVELEGGTSIFDILRRKRDADAFKVRTPEAVVMVKGTRFSVALDGGLAVSVFRGLVGVLSFAETLEHEVLVRPGFTAIVGGDLPIELKLKDMPDPWEAWAKGEPAPTLKQGADRDQPPANLAVEEARSKALEAADPSVIQQAMERDPELRKRMLEMSELAERAEDSETRGRRRHNFEGHVTQPGIGGPGSGPDASSGLYWETLPNSGVNAVRIKFLDGSGNLLAQLSEAQIDTILQNANGWSLSGEMALFDLLVNHGFANPSDLLELIDDDD